MRRLSPSESRLLMAFSAAVFIAVNLFAVRFWTRTRTALAGERHTLEAQVSEDKSWIVLAADFETQRQWVTANPPPAMTSDQASTALIRHVRESAESQKLTITEEALVPTEGTTAFRSADLQLKLSGAFPDIVRFLFELQKTGTWRAVRKLSMKSDTTPPNALVELQIRQYFAEPAGPAVTTTP